MLVAVLTILDVIVAALMIGGHFGLWKIPLLYGAIYLASKLFFWRDVLSFIDLLVAVYLVFVFFGHESALTWVFLSYFLYKFSVWLFSSMAN